MNHPELKPTPRQNRTIVLDFIQVEYECNIKEASYLRSILDFSMERHPELFPSELQHGYKMKDFFLSKKLSIFIRRIKVTIKERCLSGDRQ